MCVALVTGLLPMPAAAAEPDGRKLSLLPRSAQSSGGSAGTDGEDGDTQRAQDEQGPAEADEADGDAAPGEPPDDDGAAAEPGAGDEADPAAKATDSAGDPEPPALPEAGPAAGDASPALSQDDRIEAAFAAWRDGEWLEVRGLLEPIASDLPRIDDPLLRERALCTLADATISDTGEIEARRRTQASAYLDQLLDASPDFRMAKDVYTPELYDLYIEVVGSRARGEIATCRADVTVCRSDERDLQQKIAQQEQAYADLKGDYDQQEVEIRTTRARGRLLSLFPFGVSHFIQRSPGWGAAFLTSEVLVGGTGLGLLLYRTIADGCRRTRGFQRGSLRCTNNDDRDGILARRKAEEVMAWGFAILVIADIAIAQARYKPVVEVRRVKRKDLEAEGDGGRRGRRRRPREPRAKVRPVGSAGRQGASLGLEIRF